MNLRDFYNKVRAVLNTIDVPFVVLVSKTTTDGGKEGVMTLVKRETAARLIVEDRARLASAEESGVYFADESAKRQASEAERRFHATKLAFRSGEVVEQFCELQETLEPVKNSKRDS
ncbi:MAG: hypothetical protein K2X03_20585 [Bryobacteraceae bacterium]|nr:hypothetical protein [Bryobacteraceae bacterium]